MEKFTEDEKDTIANALRLYKADVKKMMVKAEKLGLKQAGTLKLTFLSVDVLLAKASK